ncbi:Hypothetical predicted protein [Lecanosticta acicola]|uniref:Thioesterase domain-containing protein n=1 Tax=Lecanosticta acicola TaxID=111012 RepID=A0AAI8YW14_9PEZI|nr:Hypothetical predicted protein [Lecanosticta acicola]
MSPSNHTPLSTSAILDSGTQPAPRDTLEPFLHIPWVARQIQQPGISCVVPNCRLAKLSGEDSLMAELLRTERTIRHCVSFYPTTATDTEEVTEVHTVMILGDGMNGHPQIMHGGIVATICDEAMGILMSINGERRRRHLKLKQDEAAQLMSSFTAELKITYKAPVRAPGEVVVSARRVKKEGKKEWFRAEAKQQVEEKVVLCAIGEALFIEPKVARPKPKI